MIIAYSCHRYDGTTGIMEALIEKGANVNIRGGTYGTALIVSVIHHLICYETNP